MPHTFLPTHRARGTTTGRGRGHVVLAAVIALTNPAGTVADIRPATAVEPTDGTSTRSRIMSTAVKSTAMVTLVTGDRVRLITRADGTQDAMLMSDRSDRRPGGYILHRGENLLVVPFKAVPYLRAGRLDPDLFDVTQLVKDGLDDGPASALGLILSSYSGPVGGGTAPITAKTGAAAAPTPPPHSTVTTRSPGLGLTGVRVRKDRARAFWEAIATDNRGTAQARPSGSAAVFAAGVGKLWLDRKVHAALDRSVGQIAAPVAHAGGLDGAGVTVAVLDTGIDNENGDVAPAVTAERNFTAEDSTDDLFGHGTHVASIIAGSGAASSGTYRGIAPAAKLIDARVLDSHGNGDESAVLAGMEWAAQQGAQVINLSLTGRLTDGTDPLSLAINNLTARYGSLFVAAAGDCGSERAGVSSPGAADAALTVGAVDGENDVTAFSSPGPREGDGAIKPEVTAPGVDIIAAQAGDTEQGHVIAPGYTALSGTSVAAPHVAGAAALLRQQNPVWGPAQLKAGLVATAKPSPNTSIWSQGVGRVDVAAAISAGGLTVDHPTLSLGINPWPHGAHPIQTRTLRYTNGGATATSLTLAAGLTGIADRVPPTGVLSLSSTTLNLAPGASGTVTVTVDPNKADVGHWGGLITATSSAGTTLRTAIGFTNEAALFDLTVKVLDRQGRSTTDAVVMLFNPQTGETYESWHQSDPARTTFQVSPGSWSATALLVDGTSAMQEISMAVQPEFTVTGDRTLTIDASPARPVQLSVPDPQVATAASSMQVRRVGEGGDMFLSVSGGEHPATTRFYATPTAAVSTGSLTLSVSNSLRVPELAASVVSPIAARLHPELQWPDNRLDGRRRVEVADASGNVMGKLALLGVSQEGPIDSEISRLAEAGAIGVLAYDAVPYITWWVRDKPSVPAIWLCDIEGRSIADLLGQGAVHIQLAGMHYSPRAYELAKEWASRIPTDPVVRYDINELARIEETYRHSGPGAHAREANLAASGIGGGSMMPVPVGGRRTLFVTPQVAWGQVLEYGSVDASADDGTPWPVQWEQPYTTYRAGRTTHQTWLAQVARPAQPGPGSPGRATRYGDEIFINPSPWTDGNGRFSRTWESDEPAWKLSSDGTVIASGDSVEISATLPAPQRRYTLDFTDRLKDPSWVRSTRTTTRWTFTSAHTDPGSGALLPLLSVDAALPLDVTNSARAGTVMTFNVTGRMPGGLSAVRITSLSLQTSADGGKTWRPARARRVDNDTFSITVTNPAKTAEVALRISAEAEHGLSIRQEVMAAYAVK